MLGEGGPFDLDRMQAVQLDQVSGLARDFLPFLPAADAGPAGQRDVRTALAAWDGTMRVDRPEPLIFAAWQREFGLWLAGRALGADLADLGAGRPGFLRRALGGCRSTLADCSEAAASTFATAVAGLEQHYGSDWRTWRWGDAHPAVLGHRPFDAQPGLRDWFSRLVPVGGDATTVNVAGLGRAREEIPYGAAHAAGYRAIYDLAQPDRVALGGGDRPVRPFPVAALWRSGHVLVLRSLSADEHERRGLSSRCDRHLAADAQRPIMTDRILIC